MLTTKRFRLGSESRSQFLGIRCAKWLSAAFRRQTAPEFPPHYPNPWPTQVDLQADA
jgi:hypothetical protein